MDGFTYVLLCSKMRDKSNRGFKKRVLDLYYVAVHGGKINTKWDVKGILETWGDFSALDTRKIMSRLELLVSPCDKCRLFVNVIKHSDIEIIKDNYNDECGFIPKALLDKLKPTPGRTSIQVRIFCGEIGIVKGMLTLKDGISKIQITEDMIKVPKSTKKDKDDRVVMVVRECFPSIACMSMDKLLDPEKKYVHPPKSRFDFDDGKKKETLNPSIKKIWMELGVEKDDIDKYMRDCKADIRNVYHAAVMGVVDPTGVLPEKHVFITGMTKDDDGNRVQFGVTNPDVFVARYPCLVERDTSKLNVVSNKPARMLKKDWEMLCSLPFGQIIFSIPKSKDKVSLPQMLGGDLDGDLYFICWNKHLLDQIKNNTTISKKIKQVLKERRPQ